MAKTKEISFDSQDDEDENDFELSAVDTDVVLHASDWTTETVINQIRRGNIQLDPRFQRRDAWSLGHKSKFIESLILGLPIPQIVLAEQKDQRGKFIVLDGKQRLLSLYQFWGLSEDKNNGFKLRQLEILKSLNRKSYQMLEEDSAFEKEVNALQNQTIRTVVLKNWRTSDFLHVVFLRLNTGSVKLNPQELRQALYPGEFTNFVDDFASNSTALRTLLNIDVPDRRMRDVELLARYFAFRNFISDYKGRMKQILDKTFETFNKQWSSVRETVESQATDFEAGVNLLLNIFGDDLARKPGSQQFNKAIFDALIYYTHHKSARQAIKKNPELIRQTYSKLFERGSRFAVAIESDTAGTPNTAARLGEWGQRLSETLKINLTIPLQDEPPSNDP